jgi:hypothetical protein
MSRKTPILGLMLFTVCLVPRVGVASTVTLEFDSASSEIFPYAFEINGSHTLYDLSCLNHERTNGLEDSWTAHVVNPGTLVSNPGNNASTVAGGTVNDTEVQDAIWSVLVDSGVGDEISGPNASAEMAPVDNLILAAQNTTQTAAFYSEFTYYYSQTWSDDRDPESIPQQFLDHDPPPGLTPEPSSLILMGSGIIGLAGVTRRRLTA